MIFLEYIYLQRPRGCVEGRRAYFIGMSVCFIFYHTWHVSDLISSTKCGAVVIYVARELLTVGLQNTDHWSGTCLVGPSWVCWVWHPSHKHSDDVESKCFCSFRRGVNPCSDLVSLGNVHRVMSSGSSLPITEPVSFMESSCVSTCHNLQHNFWKIKGWLSGVIQTVRKSQLGRPMERECLSSALHPLHASICQTFPISKQPSPGQALGQISAPTCFL